MAPRVSVVSLALMLVKAIRAAGLASSAMSLKNATSVGSATPMVPVAAVVGQGRMATADLGHNPAVHYALNLESQTSEGAALLADQLQRETGADGRAIERMLAPIVRRPQYDLEEVSAPYARSA